MQNIDFKIIITCTHIYDMEIGIWGEEERVWQEGAGGQKRVMGRGIFSGYGWVW